MSNPTGVATKNIEAQGARSTETPGEQPASSYNEVVSVNTAATEALTGAVQPLATEYEQQKQKLEDKAAELTDIDEDIAQQQKDLAEQKVLNEESKKELDAAQNKLKEEGAKQSAVATAELGKKIGDMVGKDNPAFKKVIRSVPAGLTEADVKMVVDDGIKKMALDIAQNIVDPTAKTGGDMSPSEEKRASEYARRFGGDASAAKVLEGIQAREVERQQTQDRVINSSVAGIADPEQKKVAAESYKTGYEALETVTDLAQSTNIRNALATLPGMKIRFSDGTVQEVSGHEGGYILTKGTNKITGGEVTEKIKYENFLGKEIANHETYGFQHLDKLFSFRQQPPTTPIIPPTSTPESAPKGDVENSSSTSGTTPERTQYTGPTPTTSTQTPAERAEGDRTQQASGDPGETPEPVGLEQTAKDRAVWRQENGASGASGEDLTDALKPTDGGDANHGGGANTHGNGKTARDFVPVEANGSAQSAPNPYAWGAGVVQDQDTQRGSVTEEANGSARPDSAEKPSDIYVNLDNLPGTRDGNEKILDKKLPDGSGVIIGSRFGDGTRLISIRTPNTNKTRATVYLQPNGSVEKIESGWTHIEGAERDTILSDLKTVGIDFSPSK